MAKEPVAVSIFIAGLVAGMIFGIGLKTGIDPDEEGVALLVLERFCEATEGLNERVSFNCSLFLTIGIILSIILAIVAVFVQATRVSDWRVGLAIYGSGWIVGMLFILLYVN